VSARSRALVAAAGLTVVVSASLCVPRAAAGTGGGTVEARFGTQTWYQPDPSCQTPAGCSPVTPPAADPYPAGTLHVARSGGQETARTYLALASTELPQAATVTSATLTIPVDTAMADGSMAPETATLQVCPASGAVATADGSFDPPPPTSCVDSVPLTYAATPVPELTADLGSLLSGQQAQLASGTLVLGVLPQDPSATPTASWHVVFSADARQPATPPPPSLTIDYQTAGSQEPAPTGSDPAPSAPPAAAATPSTPAAVIPRATPAQPVPAVGGTTGAPPELAAPALAAPAPAAVPTPSVAPAPSGAATTPPALAAGAPAQPAPVLAAGLRADTTPVGFSYPVVLLAPLALGLLGYALVRIMTRDVSRRPS